MVCGVSILEKLVHDTVMQWLEGRSLCYVENVDGVELLDELASLLSLCFPSSLRQYVTLRGYFIHFLQNLELFVHLGHSAHSLVHRHENLADLEFVARN